MTSARLTAMVLALLVSATASAQIELASVEPLQVDFAGARIIGDLIIDPEPSAQPETWPVEAEGWAQVVHRWLAEPGSKLRQEVAVRPDRFELTHMRFLEPDVTGVTFAGVLLPLELLDGARCEFVGSPRQPEAAERSEDAWTATLGADGVRTIRSLEYLRVYLDAGAVDFDCRPKGAWGGNAGVSKATPAWTLVRGEDGWRLYSADGKARRGGIHELKLVIVPAREVPVAEVHPQVNTRWTEPYAAWTRISFGDEAVAKHEQCTVEGARVTRDERFVGVQPARVEGVSAALRHPGRARWRLPGEPAGGRCRSRGRAVHGPRGHGRAARDAGGGGR